MKYILLVALLFRTFMASASIEDSLNHSKGGADHDKAKDV